MKSRMFFLISLLFLSINTSFADIKDKNNRSYSNSVIDTHPKNWKNAEIATLLKKGKVISICPMKEHLESCGKKVEFEGEVYLVELDNGLKAVFKSLPKDD